MPRSLSPWAAGVLATLLSRSALAQVNTDVGLAVGATKRFTTRVPDGVAQPGFGPVADLRAHVAALPMLRVGLYVAYDLSPVPNQPARSFLTGGLHVKVSPPLLSAPWKTYLFTGFGAGYVSASGGSSGGVLEIPLGLGLARRVSPSWEPFIELGGRFGVDSFGQMYQASHPGFVGADSFALSLTVGVSLIP